MILIAPDKFKGTFSSTQIGEKIQRWLSKTKPEEELLCIEMADGGEGTARILARCYGMEEMTEPVYDPMGEEEIDATYYLSEDGSEMVLDSAAFLGREAVGDIDSYSPMDSTTFFLGQFLRGMNRAGVKRMKIGVGGTMTVDGGAGLLQALGYLFIDDSGDDVPSVDDWITPRHLQDVYRIIPTRSLPAMFDLMRFKSVDEDDEFEIEALVDVRVPVVPERPRQMSSLSFAPQKGVEPEDMPDLLDGLANLQECIEDYHRFLDLSEAGAGGGLAMALQLCDARMLSGAEYLLDLQLKGEDERSITEVYTGEGCFDLQSFKGKVTGTIINRYARRGIPVTVVCGRCDLPDGFKLPENVTVKLLAELE